MDRNINLAFEGPNGIGKTTLINKVLSKLIEEKIDDPIIYRHYGAPILTKNVADSYKSECFLNIEFQHIEENIKLIQMNGIKLFDRLSFTGTFFFGPKYRKYNDTSLLSVQYYLESALNWQHLTLFMLHRDIDLTKVKDNYLNDEDRQDEIYFYYHKLPLILSSMNIDIININVDEIDKVFKFVK